MRKARGELGKAEAVQEFLGALAPLRAGLAVDFRPQHHVFDDRAPRQQQILLQHEGDVRVGAFDRLAVDEGGALARRIKAGADVEQRALTAAARADQRHHLGVADRQAHAGDRGDAAACRIGKAHRDVSVLETCRSRHPCSQPAGALCGLGRASILGS